MKVSVRFPLHLSTPVLLSYVFFFVTAGTSNLVSQEKKGPELKEDSAARVKRIEGGAARGKNMISGETYEGDVLNVLQELVDDLGKNGGPGGKIVIQDGTYVTSKDKPLLIRSNVHLAAASRQNVVIRMADGAVRQRSSTWFIKNAGDGIRNVVIDGIVFDGNRETQNVTFPLAEDASEGDSTIKIKNAEAWQNVRGYMIRSDRKGINEKIKVESIDRETGEIELKKFWGHYLTHDYSTSDNAEVVYFGKIGACSIHGENFAIRNCKAIRTQESPVFFVHGGSEWKGPKVLEKNTVLNHRGDACIRLQRSTRAGVIRDCYVQNPIAWYARSWGEGIAIEGNHHSIVEGNIVVGYGDRLLRANDAHHCTISDNIVWVPVPKVFHNSGTWKPLQGDETLTGKKKGKPPIKLEAGSKRNPGVQLTDLSDEARNWKGSPEHNYYKARPKIFNRLYVKVKPSESGVNAKLELTDADGSARVFRSPTWEADKWQTTGFFVKSQNGTAPLTNAVRFGDLEPLDSASEFTVSFWFKRTADNETETDHQVSNVMLAQAGDGKNGNLEIGTGGGNVEVYLRTDEENSTRTVDAKIENGAWYHLALTYDGERQETTRLYLNGENVKSWSGWGGALKTSKSSPLAIGNSLQVETPFQGLMDEFCVLGRALNDAGDVRKLMDKSATEFTEQMPEVLLSTAAGGSAEDLSGRGNHGKVAEDVKFSENGRFGQALQFSGNKTPEKYSESFDKGNLETVNLSFETNSDDFQCEIKDFRRGHFTAWGITLWGAAHTTLSNNTFYGVGREAIYFGSGGWSYSHGLSITGNSLFYCLKGIQSGRQGERLISVNGNVVYNSIQGGIGGHGIKATGNIIAYQPTSGQSLTARVASGNYLYNAGGIEATDSATSITGNLVENYTGSGIVSRNNEGVVISDNMLKNAVSDGASGIKQSGGSSGNLIRGNLIDGATHGFKIAGTDSVISGNLARNIQNQAIVRSGSGNQFTDNKGAPVARAEVTLQSGQNVAARLNGVSKDISTPPEVRSVKPQPDGEPPGSFSVKTINSWNQETKSWDVLVIWREDPGQDMNAEILVDQ